MVKVETGRTGHAQHRRLPQRFPPHTAQQNGPPGRRRDAAGKDGAKTTEKSSQKNVKIATCQKGQKR